MRLAGAILLVFCLALPAAAQAQTEGAAPAATPTPAAPAAETPAPQAAPAQPPAQTGLEAVPERIEIGLSTETIAITSDFSGIDLTIFGAVDNVDPLVQRQGRYDVFVILEGPSSNAVTRRKGRVFGIWMNVDSQDFVAVPESFLIASTRQPRDIADLDTLSRLSLGVDQIRLRADEQNRGDDEDVKAFTEALRRLKAQGGLFQEFPSGVQFISQSLFRATLRLPANVPLGRHIARAYLFRQGVLAAQTQSTLIIRKAGLEYRLYAFAQNQSLYYGLVSVVLAFVVGWLGRVLFKKD